MTFAASTRRTDYTGEFIYENDVLQFINHEEGRIVVSGEKLLLNDGCENAGDKTASNATLATHTANGEQYVKVTANGTTVKTGVFPIGGSFTVSPGERYLIRAKGYRTGANAVYLLIKANTTDLGWPGAALPNGAGAEAWTEQIVTIPTGTSTLQAGVTWNTVTAGQIFYLNEFEIVQITTVDPEYQYHLKDHLGNVRVTFTSKEETDTYTATLENNTQAEEQATFKNYSRITADVYDHTDAGTTYDKAQLLNGGNNSQVGLTKSLAVMPGDVVSAEVYAKYFETTGGSGNLSGFAAALLSAFGLPTPAGGEAGTAAAALQDYGAFIAGGGSSGTSGWPKGWLNMLVFDKDYNLVDLAYEQLDEAYMQPIGNPNKLPMQLLSLSKTIKEPGYVYIYISNEGSVQQDIYFDDLSITHEKTRVIQNDDYYPFGLTFNSSRRENSFVNDWKFQGQENIDDLGLNWDSFKWRNHQPDIGRFLSIDPMASAFYYNSPYAFSENKVTTHIELEGLEAFYIHGTLSGPDTWTDDLVEFVRQELTTNKSVDVKFSWNYKVGNRRTMPRRRNWLLNKERDRITAAEELVTHVMQNRKDGEGITLVGHSHGGNVAILAAGLLWNNYGISVNIVNFNTPAYNGSDDPENPRDNIGINTLTHFYTKQDGVAGGLAPGSDNRYHAAQPNVRQVMLWEPQQTGWISSHLLGNINKEEVKEKKPDADRKARKRSGGG